MEEYKILIIDDDELVGVSLKKALVKIGYSAFLCQDPNEINQAIKEFDPDLILLDIYLSDEINGIDVLKNLIANHKQIPVVMITGYADVQIAVNAMKIGAKDFLLKPIDIEQLKFILEKNLEPVKLRKQVLKLQQLLQDGPAITREYFGKSDTIRKVLDLAEKFAQTDNTTILIEGESGTGKEVMAKFIHSMSPRRQGPFITVNCGAIPKELAESELFGYEKGAFTGAAAKTKLGKFELADNGTLLLDEIGELSLDLQVKLLRVLQEKKFYRLGGEKEVAVNVRIIAATNRTLEKEVEEKRFREDLYYRLNVGKIYLPPLRERKEDIPLLVTMFLDEICKNCNIEVKSIESEALDFLKELKWKGNIRELHNAVERAIILSNGNTIKLEDFSFLKEYDEYVKSNSKQTKDKENQQEENNFQLKVPETGVSYNQFLKSLIEQTLDIAAGDLNKAAKMLDINVTKLKKLIEELDINHKLSN